jgi:dTDP-4-amino-4,6-dideoxygalactose transaminase
MRAFPHLGSVSTMVVSVPIFPAMTAQQTETVVAALSAGPE